MVREHWGSRFGFILAAAGSAVGLGNIWGFPYMTGQNGGGLFVLVYLACVAVVGLPIMMAEIFIGRTTQKSPVGAYRALSSPGSPWMGLGWLNVATAFVILSFYSVVAGWSLHFVWLSITEGFAGKSKDEIEPIFSTLTQNGAICTMWHVIFMVLTIGIVAAGVKGGIELCAKILLPTLFFLMLVMVVWGMTTDRFFLGFKYIAGIHDQEVVDFLEGVAQEENAAQAEQQSPADANNGNEETAEPAPQESSVVGRFTASSWLTALGQAFFSLSLGMGALITYGSYLKTDEDVVSTSIIVSVLDTSVALLAALLMFPILFSAGLGPNQEEGLAFVSLPIAFSQMPGGTILAPAFFLLLAFAGLTSSISLLEVATSYFIDERNWSRVKAATITGGIILLLGVPSALSFLNQGMFSSGMQSITENIFGDGKSWLQVFVYASFNLMLPLGGLGIACFVAWRVGSQAREQGFKAGSRLGQLYWGWVFLLKFIVPIAVFVVLLNAIGVFNLL